MLANENEIGHMINYQSLIVLCTEYDEGGSLANWRQCRPDSATYTFALTAVEMVQATGQYCDEKTMQSVLSSPVLALCMTNRQI